MDYNKFLEVINHRINRAALGRLKKIKRFTSGNIKIEGWDIDYVDSYALWSSIDILIHKRWNDFATSKQEPVILDCGANIGVSALNYKRKFPGARITAFEPDPGILRVLKRNLRVNAANDVKVVEAAVWTKNGKASFFSEGADGSRIVSDTNNAFHNLVVDTIDFREVIAGPVDLIKMDIEGAEFDVIPHIQNKLSLVQNIVIECHIDNSKIHGFSEMLASLDSSGFQVSINSYGAWRDLIHKPGKLPNEFDQYILLAAWRNQI